ncbi:probable LRR receptor-like serine/threonine-protein kinase At1g56140 isoform X2 [Quercus suber]|uniref:probable LRR receptor-like serine/threonine-protein kinase At1g56140 isoform X2 n=2 Tax=Quercus suber TaxID=58331 RepID=UPI0032DFF947
MVRSPPFLALAFCAAIIFGQLLEVAQSQSQNKAQPRTDPAEVRALNSVFQKWGISAQPDQWNISGEPCSGAAIDSTNFDDPNRNPFIKCDCSFNNSSTCHITQLKVSDLDVVGVIPEELWSLTFLFNLNLSQNYLTGSLSVSIGNLTSMQYLSLSTNKFSGSLPSELGNLVKLEEFNFDSSGISGELPSTFAKLQNLQIVWASDTNLTGRIPDFIGTWSNLVSLALEGNSFQGPIPSTFSSLTSLVDLRISGLSNGSSSLAFIKDMKSLSFLRLRNNDISDSIPSNIGEYQQLSFLDLSFNNIVGQIPDSLFNLSLLHYLFLGNNELSGTLPTQKIPSLHTVDLSYNYLVGSSLPSWVNQPNLQLNLVANNFTLENSSAFPSGLNCLQRSFPCHRGSGIYSGFAIKCGGPNLTTSTQTRYERENETLGPAAYYVTNTNKWAVSNVGLFTGRTKPAQTSYSDTISTNFAIFTNDFGPEFFQTARLSASSLRYYGLGLQNGNYIVTLQFAETVFPDNKTWKSLGKRMFDIYIQGNLVSQDFDIRKEAGGSYIGIERDFPAQVSENYLEIHFFWAGKGTCCIPVEGTYGPSISVISAINNNPFLVPNATTEFTPSSRSSNGNLIGLIVGISIGVGGILSVFIVFYIIRKRKRLQTNHNEEELLGIDVRPFTFSYAELKTATEDFNPSNKLGEGGFGPVYKGTLNDGRVVAVKQLSAASHQGKNQFVTEIAIMSAVQHRNLVKLYGCCVEADKRHLVYEHLENKSLDQALFGERSLNLNWSTRYDICLGVARGLAYLHEESRLRIVHRDVKASNILLDSDLIPKISDFGLAKLYDDNKSHISTGIAGTIGYLAPEYAMRGHLTEKTDVFAFGIVALEMVSGRRNSDPSLEEEKMYLLEWAWQLHEDKREVDLVDVKLSEFNEEEVKRVIRVSFLCTQSSPTLRPSMSRVVAMLLGDIEVSTVTSKPGYLTDWKSDDPRSLRNDVATRGNVSIYYDYSESSSMVGYIDNSPVSASKPMLVLFLLQISEARQKL